MRPKLKAKVLALRRLVQVLERHITRVRWEPGDRRLCWTGVANWFVGGGQRTEVARGLVDRRWLRWSESWSSEWRKRIRTWGYFASGAIYSSSVT
jgi:hypothetical protein